MSNFHLPARLVLATLLLLQTALVSAADKPYESFGDYRVHYNVFNSTFIAPDIARLYNLTRGKDQALINIAVTKGDRVGGVPAKISGTATNLMQQQRALDFIEVREKDAVYYLTSMRFTNEEVFNFAIEVQPDTNLRPFTVKFSKTLYVDK